MKMDDRDYQEITDNSKRMRMLVNDIANAGLVPDDATYIISDRLSTAMIRDDDYTYTISVQKAPK